MKNVFFPINLFVTCFIFMKLLFVINNALRDVVCDKFVYLYTVNIFWKKYFEIKIPSWERKTLFYINNLFIYFLYVRDKMYIHAVFTWLTTPISSVHECTLFVISYAYSGKPVVINDAMANWTAPEVFSFSFFKSLYHGEMANCQFFPYKTEFQSLQDVFDMSADRAMMEKGTKPWYVGW